MSRDEKEKREDGKPETAIPEGSSSIFYPVCRKKGWVEISKRKKILDSPIIPPKFTLFSVTLKFDHPIEYIPLEVSHNWIYLFRASSTGAKAADAFEGIGEAKGWAGLNQYTP